MLPLMQLMADLIVASVIALCLLFVAYVVSWRLCHRLDTLTRWSGGVAALVGTCTAVFHLLAWRHAFVRGYVTATLVAVVIAAWPLSGGRRVLAVRMRRDRRFTRWVLRRLRRSPYRLITAALVACTLPAIGRAIILPPLGWDALTYHAVKAAMWVQHGGGRVLEGPGPWAYYQHMPAGAEVLQAWTMLPLSSDGLTTILDVALWLAVGLGVVALARQVGVREPLASAAAGFVLSIPCLRLMLGSAYSEPFLLSMLLIGLALLFASDQEPGALILGGAALGLSAAAKVSMLPVTGATLLLAVGRGSVRHHPGRAVMVAALAAYAAAVLPWFIASAVDTGLPFSPFDIRIGSRALGVVPPEVAWYVDRSLPPGFDWRAELSILQSAFAWPADLVDGVGIFGLVPLVGMLVGVAAFARKQAFGAAVLGAVVVSCAGFYYSSGFAPIRHTFAQNSGRFLLPALACATVIWVGSCRKGSIAARLSWVLLVGCSAWYLIEFAFTGFSPVSNRAAAEVLTAAVAVGALFYLARWLSPNGVRRGTRVAIVWGALLAMLTARDTLRDPLLRSDYTLHWFADWRYWIDAVPLIDDPRERYHIAVTSGPVQNADNWFVYPFMGRRLQNEVLYVPVSGDGRLDHFGAGDWSSRLSQRANYWAWRLRLERLHVTHVMSFSPPSLEIGWMEEHPESFERLSSTPGDWGLFRVLEPARAAATTAATATVD